MEKPDRISPDRRGSSQRFSSTRDLGDRGVVAVVETRAILRVGQEEVPESELPGLGLELLDDGRNAPLLPVVAVHQLVLVGRLARHDPLEHEALDLFHGEAGSLGVLEVHAQDPQSPR
jgi:hypothetical protein